MKPMIQGILFDMDGVLFDTERLAHELMPKLSLGLGYPMSEEVFNSLLGIPNEQSRKLLAAKYGSDYPYDDVMGGALRQFLKLAAAGQLPLKKGVAECMAGLRARGLKRALVTGTARTYVESYIAGTPALQGTFDVILCSTEAGRGKPAPDPYLTAAARLGLSPESCAGVEDSLNGVKSLRAAGCLSVMIPDLLPYGKPFHGLTDYVLNDLTQLCPLLDRLRSGAVVRGFTPDNPDKG